MTETPEDELPVIFLDLDNVLITHRACFAAGDTTDMNRIFDPVAIGLLNRITDTTRAKLVLCTAHRDKPSIRDTLRRNGVTGAFHQHFMTDLGPGPRGGQVQRWLDQHPEVKNYVILDDLEDAFLPSQAAHHVRPPKRDGLSFQNFLDALKILGAAAPRTGVKFRILPTYGG